MKIFQFKYKVSKYKGFTLLEMLIVMTIFIILMAVTASAFSGLRASIALNENTITLQQDIRSAQRSALLLKRDSSERWLYGIGIDLRNLSSNGKYTTFKWCSPYNEYGPTPTESTFPSYDPFFGGSQTKALITRDNGGIPASNYGAECLQSDTPNPDATGYLTRVAGSTDLTLGDAIIAGFDLPQNQRVVYILFEAGGGHAFFYNSDGVLMNFSADGEPAPTPVDVKIALTTPDRRMAREMVIKSGSGKVTVRSITKAQLSDYVFDEEVVVQEPGGDEGGGDGK